MAQSAFGGEWKGKFRRALKTLALVLAAAVFAGALYLFGAALHAFGGGGGGETAEAYAVRDEEAVAPIIAGETGDIAQLREMAGFPLLYLANQRFFGEAANASYGGSIAKLITMRYQMGIVITAVAPARAAPLLKRSGLTLSSEAKTLNLQGNRRAAVCAEDGGKAACLYFTTDDAAYAIYAQGLSGDQLTALCNEYGLSAR
ncbi:MAG: hypothetical protein IJ174_02790 [Clostridia bacterium]|nr:hypothetical protein [Clostridia bacterium]